MALSGEQFWIGYGDQRVGVAEVGGGLRTYTVGDAHICPTYGDDVLPPKGCGAILMPWPNRLAEGHYEFDGADQQLPISEPGPAPYVGNAIHGLARWAKWSAIEHRNSALTLALDIVPQKGYPFEVHAEVGYALGEDGLTVTMRARNTGTSAAPFGAGAHPYLSTRGQALDEVGLLVPAAEQILVDEHAIPVGASPATDDFLLNGRPLGPRRLDTGYRQVRFADGRAEAVLTAAGTATTLWWDEAFGYTQVFTVEQLDATGDAVAIEPMSCPANAFNTGEALVRLEPGASWTGTWGIGPGPRP